MIRVIWSYHFQKIWRQICERLQTFRYLMYDACPIIDYSGFTWYFIDSFDSFFYCIQQLWLHWLVDAYFWCCKWPGKVTRQKYPTSDATVRLYWFLSFSDYGLSCKQRAIRLNDYFFAFYTKRLYRCQRGKCFEFVHHYCVKESSLVLFHLCKLGNSFCAFQILLHQEWFRSQRVGCLLSMIIHSTQSKDSKVFCYQIMWIISHLQQIGRLYRIL